MFDLYIGTSGVMDKERGAVERIVDIGLRFDHQLVEALLENLLENINKVWKVQWSQRPSRSV